MKRNERKITSLMEAADKDLVKVRLRDTGKLVACGLWYEDHILWYARRESGVPLKAYEFFVEAGD